MEIHISNWTHKFQNQTGLDAKANSELYKSNWVNSVARNLAVIVAAWPCEPYPPTPMAYHEESPNSSHSLT